MISAKDKHNLIDKITKVVYKDLGSLGLETKNISNIHIG